MPQKRTNLLLTLIILASALYGAYRAHEKTSIPLLPQVFDTKVDHFTFDELPLDTISEGITRRWFHGEMGQMAYFYLEPGAHIPWHSHPNEQITYILEGKVKIKTIEDGKEVYKTVSAGEVIIFPENVPHEFWAIERTVDLDVHVPVRQDWLSDELPDYLKASK